MSFDPRTPFEIHYVDKSGDEMVECLHEEAAMKYRASALIVRGQAKPGSIRLYHINRRRLLH